MPLVVGHPKRAGEKNFNHSHLAGCQLQKKLKNESIGLSAVNYSCLKPPKPTHQHLRAIPQMRECSELRPPSKGGLNSEQDASQPLPTTAGITTNDHTHVSINDQNACQRKGSNSAAIGALGVAVFRRQMQQVGCIVLLFHLGERFHQSPGVLRRHFTILLPFDARQFSRRHQGNTWLFNLRNLISMWPLPPSDVT